MQATTNPLSQVLSYPVRYAAPLFQRPYVWNRQANWEPFWETVREVAEHYVSGQPTRPRFLGAIVLEQINVPVGGVPTRQIIDGQQRLTTLQILLGATRDFYKERCAEKGWVPLPQIEFLLQQLTLNPTFSPQSEDRFKVWPTNSDRVHFERVMTAVNPTQLAQKYGAPPQWEEGPKGNPRIYILGKSSDPHIQRALDLWDGWNEEERGEETKAFSAAQLTELRRHFKKYEIAADHLMVKAYWYFWSSLAIWLETNDEKVFGERMQALLNGIQQSLLLVVINLDAGEDAQLIFETMNARGLPLSPADLVKNFLFREAQRAGDDIQFLYDAHWESFDKDTWWRTSVRQGRLTRPRIDAFLWNYLTLSTRHEVLSSDLFATYRDWSDSSNNSLTPSEQIVRFQEYAQIFRNFESDAQPYRIRQFITRLALLDVSTIYPLLLELFKRHQYAQASLEAILVDLESFLVRRLLVGLTTKNYNRVFFDLLQDLEKANDFSPQAVQKALLVGKGDSVRWPDDDEFKKALLSRPLYGNIKVERLNHVLQALDKEMHTSKNEKYQIQSKLTIEHLMPQKWQTHWTPSAGISSQDAEVRDVLVDTLGNLTLITGELNSSLSNSAWTTKKPEIEKFSGIIFNRSLPSSWNEDEIKKRSEELFGYSSAIWPYPTSTSV